MQRRPWCVREVSSTQLAGSSNHRSLPRLPVTTRDEVASRCGSYASGAIGRSTSGHKHKSLDSGTVLRGGIGASRLRPRPAGGALLRTQSASERAKPRVISDISSADTSGSGSPMAAAARLAGRLALSADARSSAPRNRPTDSRGSSTPIFGASVSERAAASVSNTSSFNSVTAVEGDHWTAVAGLSVLPTVAARLQDGLRAGGGELPRASAQDDEEAPTATSLDQQPAQDHVSEQAQHSGHSRPDTHDAAAGGRQDSNAELGIRPPNATEVYSVQDQPANPSVNETELMSNGGGHVATPSDHLGATAASDGRRPASRSFRQHRAMRALRAQSGGSNGGGGSGGSGGAQSGASSAGPASRSNSQSNSRPNSRAGSLREAPAASPTQPASAQRRAASAIEQSLDPLLRARVEELAQQAVAARLRGRLSSGETASPVLTSGETSEADIAAALAGVYGDGGPGLESQRSALSILNAASPYLYTSFSTVSAVAWSQALSPHM